MLCKILDFIFPEPKQVKGYTPKEFGTPELKEIQRIYLGACGIKSEHTSSLGTINVNGTPSSIEGHAHVCTDDKSYKSVCIRKFAKNKDGTIHDVLWHEYGHILDVTTHRDCKSEDHDMHGDTFKDIMHKIGKPHLASPYISMNEYGIVNTNPQSMYLDLKLNVEQTKESINDAIEQFEDFKNTSISQKYITHTIGYRSIPYK